MRIALLILAGAGLLAEELQPVQPGAEWARAKPEAAEFSSAKLEALRGWLRTQQTTAMMVVYRGRVIFEYGDIARVSKVASVRKSVLAMLYGNYVADGRADLHKTVEALGLADVQPFLPIEKGATLRHLLTARSGIYHPSGNEELTVLSPRRGTSGPGTYFQYQNWDFNAAGTAFEKISGKDIFEAVETELAVPLGMQDFDRKKQRRNSSLPDSVHPEYAMYLSTRDMARLGLLMLSDGNWNGKQVMPKGWARTITTLVTPHHEMHPTQFHLRTRPGLWGYGMLWWVWDAPEAMEGAITGPYQGAYSAIGSNGQYITVLPAADLVFVHKVDFDTDGSRQITPEEFHTLLGMVLSSNL
jgi:CubicO group peptidase (beta-lactamase class C family)